MLLLYCICMYCMCWIVGQTLEEVRDAYAIWGSEAAVITRLVPSRECGKRVRRTDKLTRNLTGRRS